MQIINHHHRLQKLFGFGLMFLGSSAHGGGTISFMEEIVPLLERTADPGVFDIIEPLDIQDVGSALRLGGETPLVGARVCPCVFDVQTKGPTLLRGTLEIRTDWRALNSHDVEVDFRDPEAVRIEQQFSGLSLDLSPQAMLSGD